jgi:hypothetical protein
MLGFFFASLADSKGECSLLVYNQYLAAGLGA